MRRPRPIALVRRAVANLRGAPLPAMASMTAIAVAVFLFGAFVVTGENLGRALRGWAGSGDHVTVYLDRGWTGKRAEAIREALEGREEIVAATYVSPEEGMRELARALGVDAGILAGVDPAEVLPPVIRLRLRPEALDPARVGEVAREIGGLEGVSEVGADALWLEEMERLAEVGRGILAGWAALLAAGLLLVVGNAARLAAYTRKDEIEVLCLVGAPDGFILGPFAVEGFLEGALGSILGTAVLAAATVLGEVTLEGSALLVPLGSEIRFLDGRTLVALLLAGPLLGGAGSLLSAWRFLRQVSP